MTDMAAHARRVVSGVANRNNGGERVSTAMPVSAAKRDGVRRGRRVRHRKTRNSSIELLRIIAMLMITAHHYLLGSDIYLMTQPFGISKVLLETFLYSGGKIGVVVFFAISAWYLSEHSTIRSSLRRVWILERELLFWGVTCLTVGVVLVPHDVTATVIIKSVFPLLSDSWWYATSYCVFLLMFPCLAPALRMLGRQRHAYLAVTMFLLWTVLQGFVPVFAVGLHGGDFLSFVYLYILMTYYRWYMRPMSVRNAWIMLVAGYVLILCSVVAGGLIYHYTGNMAKIQTVLLSTEYKLPTMMVGFALFVLFINNEFYSRTINFIATSAFSVYLITDHPIIYKHIWHGMLSLSRFYDSPFVVFIVIGVVIAYYGVCVVLDHIRLGLFRVTVDRHRGRWFDRLWDHAAASRIGQSVQHDGVAKNG